MVWQRVSSLNLHGLWLKSLGSGSRCTELLPVIPEMQHVAVIPYGLVVPVYS